MKEKPEFFLCDCHSPEHLIMFDYDEEMNYMYMSVFLDQYRPWYKRIGLAIKYVFGYTGPYGHYDTWILKNTDIVRFKKVLNQVKKDG